MQEFKIQLKHLDDGYIVVSATDKQDARKKVKRMFKKTLRTDFENEVAIHKMKIVNINKQ
jgi:hypothetical protein